MPGGLLNIISYGNQNVFLNGNPSKTFFKFVYAKYTNFGLQKFRIDYEGQKEMRLNDPSEFVFKVPRYAELLMDTYFCITLPNIWSPIYPPSSLTEQWKPYEFKWIENIGTECIKEVQIIVGGHVIQQYSGTYIKTLFQRDHTGRRGMFDEMTGDVNELHNPSNANGRHNKYPSAYFTNDFNGSNPSINARKLYVPLGAFFTFDTRMALPLVALQYCEMHIHVTLRPIKELFTINDITNSTNNTFPRIQPNFSLSAHSFFKFLQPPPSTSLNSNDYENQSTSWRSDIHLISTYCFLTEDEGKVFAKNEQKYLIKQVREKTFHNLVESKKVNLETNGMVSSWTWFLRRSDAYLRNEWDNYTNYEYRNSVPNDIDIYPAYGITDDPLIYEKATLELRRKTIEKTLVLDDILQVGPCKNPNNAYTGICVTKDASDENSEKILQKVAIIIDGKYRENDFDSGVYEYLEKFRASKSTYVKGLYCYNFTLKTDPYTIQPHGAINFDKFRNTDIEIKTLVPPMDPDAETLNICTEDGELIGVNKPSWNIYKYTYDMFLMEERYNIVVLKSGTMNLMYA